MNFKKKMVGLMLMAALAVVPLASCGTTGDNGSGDGSSIVGGVTVPFEETGAYYCATPDGEGALTISENDFAWAVGSETLNGTYAYDGETLTFTFADGATATATVDGTTLTFKRGNETYIFYKNVKFIVTFKAGTTSTTAEVVNGKAVAVPADPEADDAWFVGWYTSADKLYDFSTPVMGDMTLTARFVDKVEQQEFKVTLYKDGAEYSVLETRGGKLYENELPVLEEAGKTFLGWWVGYEEGAKLSYKYNEHKLGQDTALYAVWASVNPTVSVTATGAAWTNAGSGTYNVTVKNEKGEEVASTTTPKTEYKFNFADKAAGVYSVEVSDVANASLVGVAYYRNKMLDKVNYFEVKEEVTAEGISRVLVFNPIENATKYLITAVCGDNVHSHVKVESTTPVFDFSACQMKEGGITFEVEAVADGYVSSVSAVYAYEAELAEITDLAVNDETEVASWTAVANAEYYVVEIIDDGVSLGVKNVTGTQVSLRGLAGELQVKVYPYARAFNSSVIKTVSYTNNRLATPTNLALNGTNLVWNAVAGAEKYLVKIGDNEYEALTNTLDLTSDDYFENCGMEVAISVKAVSANAGEASRYSDVFTVRLDNTMDASTLSYSAGSISWGAVLGAESYGVRVCYPDGTKSATIYTLNGTITSLPITFTQAGAVTIEVCSRVQGSASAWVASQPVNVYKLTFDVAGGIEVSAWYKAYGDPMNELPTTSLTGFTFKGWYNVANALENNGVKQEPEIFQWNQDTVFYAGYESNPYKVTYVLDDNSILKDDEGKDLTEGEVLFNKMYQLDTPISQDAAKVFAGWYTAPNGSGMCYTDMYGKSLNVWITAEDGFKLYPAWYNVLNFTEVTENGVTTYAVSQDTDTAKIEYLTIPAVYNGVQVTKIDAQAFANCGSLKEIFIPDTVTEIFLSTDNQTLTSSAFVGCSSLEKISVYCASDGNCAHEVVYESDESGALLFNNAATGKKEIKYLPEGFKGDSYVIPNGVEVIPTSAFYGKSLKSITIPASVIEIASSAFAECTSLTELVFLEAQAGTAEKTLTLSNDIFAGCDSLKVLNLPKRVANLEAFINPTEEGVKSIFNSWLTDINITGEAAPDADENKVYYSMNGVLFCGDTLVYAPRAKAGEYRIPQSGDPEVVITTIGANAFKNCTAITKVTIPQWVTLIEEDAFRGCNITSLIFEATDEDEEYGTMLTIKSGAFYLNYGGEVTEVVLPVNLAKVEANAFYGSGQFTTVTVLSANTEFAEGAFASDSGSSNTNNIYLGKNVKPIAISSIFGTYNVHNVYVDEENKEMVSYDGVMYNKAETEILYFPYGKSGSYVIRDTVTKLGSKLFAGTQITSITIPASVTEIQSYAFAKCQKLETVVWVDGDQELTLGDGAFAGATALEGFYIPARVSYIGKGAFARCSFTSLEIKDGDGDIELEIADYAFKNVPFEGTGVQLDFDWVEGTSSTGTGKNITNGKLVSITLPTRLRTIGTEAFYYAFDIKATTELVIPEGVTTIGNKAFAKNSGIVSISLPSTLTKMGAYNDSNELTSIRVFDGCNGLQTLTLAQANTVFKTIDGVLYGVKEGVVTDLYFSPNANTGDENGNVDIPKTVTRIWDGAFKDNKGIKSITFKEGIEGELALGEEIFYGCSSLQSVQLPEGLDEIATGMFSSCNALTSVTIPSTVATIELNAFKSCGNLTSLLFAETPEGQDAVDLTFVDGEASGSSYNMTINSIFSGCSNLKEIQLPERTKYIGKYAFSNLGLETINIPASVTTIGENAFYKCKKLTEVTFSEGSQLTAIAKHTFNLCSALTTINVPASVTAISELAFEGCASLANVTLNEGLTTIGSQAFAGTAIKSLAIPASVTTIGASAFEKCVDLATVTFAENSALTTIDEYAFGDCKVLSTITIPASVTKIGMAAFICCEKLATVNFAQGESKLTEIDSNAFASSGVTNFTFPETAGTLTFGEAMFEGCALNTVHLSSKISSITGIFDGATVENITVAETSEYFSAVAGQKVLFNKLGNGIAIVYGEFVGALDLSTIVKEDVNLTQIGENAFKDQTKITSIVVPVTVQQIGDYAFQGCTALTSVTFVSEGGQLSALNTIGKQAFDGCSALTEIKLPENVTSLGEKAFYNCSSLTKIEINKNLTTIGNYAFANAKQVKTLVIPEGVKTIGSYMFDYLGAEVEEGAITAITLPTTLTSIGDYAFRGCATVTSIAVPASVTSIGTYAFSACTALTDITLPNGITELPNYLFSGCTALSSITIPASVETIGTYVFNGCRALTSIQIPVGVTTIGQYAFQNCSSLTSLTIPASVTNINAGAFRYTDSLTSVTFTEPETAVATPDLAIGNSVFELATPSTTEFTVTFNSRLNTLGNSVFKNRGLKSVVIPEGATKIGDSSGVFEGCTMLESATFGGKALTQMGKYLFKNCTALTSVTIREGTTFLGYKKGSSSTTTYLFQGCTAENFSLTIPTTVVEISKLALATSGSSVGTSTTGLNITSVDVSKITTWGDGAFAGCKKLAKVTFGSVSKIGKQAFYGCTSLTSVSTTATTIGANAFENCTGLTTADISKISASNTNGSIFKGCTALTTATLNSSLNNIAANMFQNCTSLTSFTLPTSAKTINASAFAGCTSLTEITNLSQVTSIKASAFQDCTALTSADISKTTETNIKSSTAMFSGCTSLASVTLPSTLQTIPGTMFKGCTSLTSINIPDTVTFISANAFEGSGLTSIDLSKTKIAIMSSSATSKSTSSAGSQFKDCVNLTSVTLPSTVTHITKTVFSGCTALTTINFADLTALTLIGEEAFANTALTTFVAPKSLATLEPNAFMGVKLSSISVAEGSTAYKMIGNALCNANDELVAYPFGTVGENGVVTLPEGIVGTYAGGTSATSPKGSAFYNATCVKSVVIPSTMTTLGNGAFWNCLSLESITIPVTVTKIGKQAFKGCEALKTVVFEDSETAEDLQMGTINANGTISSTGSDNFFAGCGALTSVNIPARIKNIPAYMFGYSSATATSIAANLANVTLAEGIESIGNYAFAYLPIASITLPSTLTTIGQYAFRNTQIEEIVIPTSVNSIGQYAFAGTKLTSFTISANEISWGNYMFTGCELLESVTIADGVEAIPNYMFQNCTALTSVTIADSVETIGSYAFSGCTALKNIDLPASLTTIGASAFADCTALESIVIPEGVTNLGSATSLASTLTTSANIFKGCTSLASVTLPSKLEWIGAAVFQNCSALTSIDIPASVTAIGQNVFMGTGITSIEIKNPEIVMYSSFAEMAELETVVLPEGLTQLGYKLFYKCEALKNVNIPSTVTTFDTVYTANNGNKITSTGYTFSGCLALETIVIPEGITVIPIEAFAATGLNDGDPRMSLKNINIPSTVVEIRKSAFRGCDKIESIVIPRGTILSNTIASHFQYWTAEQTVYICATKSFVDRNWHSSWDSSCKAKIVYNYRPAETPAETPEEGTTEQA